MTSQNRVVSGYIAGQRHLTTSPPMVLKQLIHIESRLTFERNMVTGGKWESFLGTGY